MRPTASEGGAEARYAALPQGKIEIGPHRLHTVDTGGEGPVLVLVHGSPISSFGFREQITLLHTCFRVLAPDLLGFGESSAPEAGAGFGEEAAALRDLLLHPTLRIACERPIAMAVHDWGGPIGLAALALCAEAGRPIALERLVLINTSLRPDFAPPFYWPFRFRALDELLVVRLNAFGHGLGLLLEAAARDPAVARHYRNALRRPATRRTAAQLERLDGYRMAAARAEAFLRVRPVEALLFWGEPEPYFGAADVRHLLGLLPGARCVRSPGAGHFPMEDAPQALAEAMSESLTAGAP